PARTPRPGPHRRPVPPPDREPPAGRPLLAPRRVQGPGKGGLRPRLRVGGGRPPGAVELPRRPEPARGQARREFAGVLAPDRADQPRRVVVAIEEDRPGDRALELDPLQG